VGIILKNITKFGLFICSIAYTLVRPQIQEKIMENNNPTKPKKFTAKKIVSYIGSLLMVVSLIFIVRRLIEAGTEDLDFALLTSPWIITGLLLVAALEGTGILGAGLNFRALLRNVSGIAVDRVLAVKVYTESNIYKYIPGGVMYVAGRNRLAVEVEELTHSKVVLSTILEGACMVIGVIVVATIFAFDYSITYVRQMDVLPIILLIIGFLAVVAAFVVYFMRDKIGGGLKRLTDNMETISWLVVAKRVGFAILLMFLYSVTFLLTLMLLGQEMTLELGFAIVGLYLLAWLAGFLTPGAPSGFGVREVVMMMFLGDFVNVSILMAAMVMHRVLTVFGDVFAYLVASSINLKKLKYRGAIKDAEIQGN